MRHGTDDLGGGEILFGFARRVDFGNDDFISVLEGACKIKEEHLCA